MNRLSPAEPELASRLESDGSTRLDLIVDGRSVSRLWIVPFTLRIGAATIRMDGIGGVGTTDEFRRRGYARMVLDAAVARMQQGDAAISMLYGIPNFYAKIGYATAGPDHLIELPTLQEPARLPAGWHIRPAAASDLPALRRIYERNAARTVGAAVRGPGARIWSKVPVGAAAEATADHDQCRVVEQPGGQVAAYAWRGSGFWYTKKIERRDPEALVLAEVMADGPAAADAVLAACRRWAAEVSASLPRPLARITLPLPPEGPVAAAAMRQTADFRSLYSPSGDSMARVLDVLRLFESLKPELSRRVQAAGPAFSGDLRFETDIGSATLAVDREGVSLRAATACTGCVPGRESLTVELPQYELARLALGAFPPEDVLVRLDSPPGKEAGELVEVLFPFRRPHMYLPDRF
jgi:hypothetical protein